MKQTIRFNTFETNSSSAHSLVYSKKNPDRVEYHLDLEEDGSLLIHFHSYNWNGPAETGDLLSKANDKLDYIMSLLCSIIYWKKPFDFLEQNEEYVKSTIYEEVPEAKKLLDDICEVIPEITDIHFALNYDGWDSESATGEIDHQSAGGLESDDYLNIIFNKGCLILVTNDNEWYYGTEEGENCTYIITEKDFEE